MDTTLGFICALSLVAGICFGVGLARARLRVAVIPLIPIVVVSVVKYELLQVNDYDSYERFAALMRFWIIFPFMACSGWLLGRTFVHLTGPGKGSHTN